jgi:hypothetical protein
MNKYSGNAGMTDKTRGIPVMEHILVTHLPFLAYNVLNISCK